MVIKMEILFASVVLFLLILIGLLLAIIAGRLKDLKPLAPPAVERIERIEIKGDVTTLIPIPMGSDMCKHDWEIISKEKIEGSSEKKVATIAKCLKCGLLDKTVVTIKDPVPPTPPIPKSECKHNWQIEKSVVIGSAFEQVAEMAKSIQVKNKTTKEIKDISENLKLPDMTNAKIDMFRKTYVSIRVCKSCGEVHTVKASNVLENETEGEDLKE
jgi:hypothetical protein